MPNPIIASAATCRTLVELARLRGEQIDDRGFTFLESGEEEGPLLSYADLDRRARAVAAALADACRPGDRVLLLYPPSTEFVAAFFGCLYAGAIAVPAYPPDPTRLQRTLPRLVAIAGDSGAKVVLTTSEILPLAQGLFALAPELGEMRWMASDAVADHRARDWRDPGAGPDDVAFLQYTSGSTGTPRGVMISHRNLLHNQRLIHQAFDTTDEDVVVSWLPLYHDMGLIGHVLQPLYTGGPCYLMSPIAFLRRPIRWLRAITRYRATTSSGPNFAFDLCVRKIGDEDRDALDLSTWRQALNGAEPVRAATLERFVERFGPVGFRRETFYPCYGLAEATLVVSGGKTRPRPVTLELDAASLERNRVRPAEPGSGEEARRRLVGCGRPATAGGQVVVIADPESGRACAPGEVGEIWITGPSVAGGYWGREEDTRATFGAELQGPLPEGAPRGPYLRTGDMGFLDGGELFITGRLKDLIIIRGENHYPHDIEWAAAESHPEVRPGAASAFALEEGGEERVAVVAEVDRRYQPGGDPALPVEEVAGAVRAAVARATGVTVHTVCFIRAGSLPKTSSGKVQRRHTREALLGRKLEVVGISTRA